MPVEILGGIVHTPESVHLNWLFIEVRKSVCITCVPNPEDRSRGPLVYSIQLLDTK